MGKLTVRQVEGAKPGDKRVMLADGDGLWLCVRPTGVKTWISRTKKAGVMREKSLGDYPSVSLSDARKLHAEQSKTVKSGISRELTFGDAFDQWLSHYAKTPSTRTRRLPTQGTITKHHARTDRHLSIWADTPLHKLTRGMIVTRLDQLPGKEEARQIFNMLRVFFEWCYMRGHVEQSPLLGVRPGTIGLSQSRPAGRVLSMDELRLVFDMTDGIAGHALRWIIITGMRPGEVAGMRWDEIDGEWWQIPCDRMKSRKPHQCYIGQSVSVIEPLRGLDSVCVFATGEGRHIRRDSLTTYAKRLSEALNMRHFSPHDLRRSAATHWGELLGAPPHVVELMLSHAPENKLQAVYQRGQHLDAQRSLWSRWALEFVNDGSNVGTVIPFAPRAKRHRGD